MIGDLAFAIYRFLGQIAGPLVRLYLARREARGREDAARLGERFGRAGLPRPAGSLLWIHGASVGEALSILPLVERLHAEFPRAAVLVTTGTVTSARLMAERLPAGALHQYLPVDLPGAVRRFFRHWRPQLGLVIESELWPNLLLEAKRQGVVLALLNGRISRRSHQSWRRWRPVIGRLLDCFTVIFAQSPEDAARYRDLGAVEPLELGNLKLSAAPLGCDLRDLELLRASRRDRPCWLAASTHPGEEKLVLSAAHGLRRLHPDLLTIVAPRHPHRGAEVARLLASAEGKDAPRRGLGQALDQQSAFYVADTIGELGLWYRLADLVFVGGSLVPHGGQNMLEPARLERPIIIGPHTENFEPLATDLADCGALLRVKDAGELEIAAARLFSHPETRSELAANAAAYAHQQSEVLDRILEVLRPLVTKHLGR